MINNYKRIARGFQELDAGTLSPFDFALPELRALASAAVSDQPAPAGGGPKVGQRSEIQQERRRPQGEPRRTESSGMARDSARTHRVTWPAQPRVAQLGRIATGCGAMAMEEQARPSNLIPPARLS
jgi:hypothetical protein